ncbi:MAG: deoxyribose-phosphate aldolase [Kiritimatiellae bacterium]|nr:deoxyribose-phosphate aldolase [Kiritimatiellia bacterium]
MNLEEQRLAGAIDHTLLKPDTTIEQVKEACHAAIHHEFASVCVTPVMLPYVAHELAGTNVKPCTVIGFPLGTTESVVKAFEAKTSATNGAIELDMVMAIWALKQGDTKYVLEDIRSVVKAAPGCTIKVIIETCLLSEIEKVTACGLVMDAGAHFVKTSTGLANGGATVEDIRLMRNEVGSDFGVKASGGIRTADVAMAMIKAGANRIGTSAGISFFA